MQTYTSNQDEIAPKTRSFYCQALATLNEFGVPFLVGGGYAYECYTATARDAKDLDIFVRPSDCDRALAVLNQAGYRTELSFSHWLGKAFCDQDFIDIIFKSGNGTGEVDDAWFENAVADEIFDIPVKLCPPEETICSKAFVMARDRYDGADVAHLIRACSERLDWTRLLDRFGPYWRVFLSHLILFGFVYPNERSRIPDWVMQELLHRLQAEMTAAPPTDRICQGTLLSGLQYRMDTECWGYQDARISPQGNMTAEEVKQWTVHLENNTNA